MAQPAAKQLEPPKLVAPDASQPIAMKYWISPEHLGTLNHRNLTVGTVTNDGCGTQGKVRAVWYYPISGTVIAEVEVGFRPGVLDANQGIEIKRLVLRGGHGCAL